MKSESSELSSPRRFPDLPREVREKLAEQDFEIYSLKEMMNRLQEGIYITDARGITLYVNNAFVHLSGLNREDLIGKRVHNMRDEGILPNSCCARVIETKQSVTTINNYYQGQKCLVTGSPVFDPDGNLIRTVAIVRDVSELDAMMDSLTRDERGWITELPPEAKNHAVVSVEANKYRLPESSDPQMVDIYARAARMAPLDSSILIVGETGTGKDFLATVIHNIRAVKKGGELIRINCGAIPEHLIESELFGYEKGAFTGAAPEGRRGLLETAGEGTVLLDEIGEMPYLLQVKLLNVLNDRQFYRVGGSRMIDFQARVIATTNANLGEQVKLKKFRADLYFRLNVFRISLPPLRRRRSDFPVLLEEFVNAFNKSYGSRHSFTDDAVRVMEEYAWPGNIRELKGFVEKAVAFSTGEAMGPLEVAGLLGADDAGSGGEDRADSADGEELPYPGVVGRGGPVEAGPERSDAAELLLPGWVGGSLRDIMAEHEKSILKKAIASSDTLGDAADALNIDLSTLMRKKRKYRLECR